MFEEVDSRREKLDAHRPLDRETLARLDAVFEPLFIYGSNAIEGNTLSLGDTIYLIREGKLPGGGKTEEEYLEVKGQQAAYAYLADAVAGEARLSEKLIREFHQLLTEKLPTEKYRPGQYKDRDNKVLLPDGSLFPYVSHVATPAAVQTLVSWFEGEGQALHPVERAATLHYRFILIHPFLDGNGRTARLLANFALLRGGHTLTIFRADERRRVYLDALRAVDTSVPVEELAPDNVKINVFPFVSYLEQEVLWSYDQALDVIEGRVAVTTEDLVRKFEKLDRLALAAKGITTDEASRIEGMSAAVSKLTESVTDIVLRVVKGLNDKWTDLFLHNWLTSGGARAVLEGNVDAPPLLLPRQGLLGIDNRSLRGTAAVRSLRIVAKEESPAQLAVPTNLCELVVYCEPHALTLASVRFPARSVKVPTLLDRQAVTESIHLPLDPQLWSGSVIERFVLDEVNRFLEITQMEISRANALPDEDKTNI